VLLKNGANALTTATVQLQFYSGTMADMRQQAVRVDGTGTYNFTAQAEPQFIPALEEIENVSISGNSFDAEQQSGGDAQGGARDEQQARGDLQHDECYRRERM